MSKPVYMKIHEQPWYSVWQRARSAFSYDVRNLLDVRLHVPTYGVYRHILDRMEPDE